MSTTSSEINVGFSTADYFVLTAIIVSSCLLVFFWYQRKYNNAAAWTKTYVAAVMPITYLLGLLLDDASAVVLEDGTRVKVLRYWGWLATCPVLLLDIFSAMPLRKQDQDPVQALAAVILDQLMVISGVSAIIYGGTAKIVLFCVGIAFGGLVYRLILIAFLKSYKHYPDEAKPWLVLTALLFCGGWLLFPIGWVLGREGFGVMPEDISDEFGEAYHAVADLIAKCSYSFVGWYTRHVVLKGILDRKRAAKDDGATADGASKAAGSAPPGTDAGKTEVVMALRGAEGAPKSAQHAIARIARALRAFGPGAAIVRHAVAGACDTAAAGVAAAAPAIAKSLLDAARRARARRVVRVLVVDPDPLVHTAIGARLTALSNQDVHTGAPFHSAVAAAALLRVSGHGNGASGFEARPFVEDRPAPLSSFLDSLAQSRGLPGITVKVESAFRLDDVPLVFARGDAHFDCVVATAATLRELASLDGAEAEKRNLRVYGSASLRDQLTALTMARGRAAASLAASAEQRRSSSARRARPGTPDGPDFRGFLASGASGNRILREEAHRLRTEDALGLAIKTRLQRDSASPEAESDGSAGSGERRVRMADPPATEGAPAAVGSSPGTDAEPPASGGRRLSLTEAVTGAVVAADIRRMMKTPPRDGSPEPRRESPRSRHGPAASRAPPQRSALAGVSQTEVHPVQRLFGLVPVLAVATEGPSAASTSGPAESGASRAVLQQLGADLLIRGLDDPAQWRAALGRVAREAAARGTAQEVKTPSASAGRRVLGAEVESDDASSVSRSHSRSRSHGRSRKRGQGRSKSRGGASRSRDGPSGQFDDVAPASPAAVESMLALLRPAESVAAARAASIRRYAAAIRALARAMASGAVHTASRAAARAALAGSLAASGMAYLYRDSEAALSAPAGVADGSQGGAAAGVGTAAALPELAIVLGDDADAEGADGTGLVPIDAVEWRKDAAARHRRRSSSAEGDREGPLSMSRAGRIIRRRDSAANIMQGAFFGGDADDGAGELWEDDAPSPVTRRRQPTPPPRGPYGYAGHAAVQVRSPQPLIGAGSPNPGGTESSSPAARFAAAAGPYHDATSNPMHSAPRSAPRGDRRHRGGRRAQPEADRRGAEVVEERGLGQYGRRPNRSRAGRDSRSSRDRRRA